MDSSHSNILPLWCFDSQNRYIQSPPFVQFLSSRFVNFHHASPNFNLALSLPLPKSQSRTIFRVGVSPIAERQRAPGRSFAESKARPRRAWPERATRQCALQPIAATACGSSLYYFTLTLSFPRGSNSSSTTWFALTPISVSYTHLRAHET